VCRILVIDDQPETRETITDLIESEGHSFQAASNGREAIDWLEAQDELPCLILLDLRMPVMDGWDFIRVVSSVPRLANIPVVVISGSIQRDGAAPVLRAKAFWSKPPNADLVSSVHLYCDHHRDSWKPASAS
jgi:CheY-like chemotaxis protein